MEKVLTTKGVVVEPKKKNEAWKRVYTNDDLGRIFHGDLLLILENLTCLVCLILCEYAIEFGLIKYEFKSDYF